jgi:hypothetical protein
LGRSQRLARGGRVAARSGIETVAAALSEPRDALADIVKPDTQPRECLTPGKYSPSSPDFDLTLIKRSIIPRMTFQARARRGRWMRTSMPVGARA